MAAADNTTATATGIMDLPEHVLSMIVSKIPDQKQLRLTNTRLAQLVTLGITALRATLEVVETLKRYRPFSATEQVTVSRFPNVESLDFKACKEYQVVVGFLSRCGPSMGKLNTVILEESDLADGKMARVLQALVQGCPRLQQLTVRTLNCDETLAACSTGLLHLTSLTVAKAIQAMPVVKPSQPIVSCKPFYATPATFSALAAMPQLTSVTISFPVTVTDAAVAKLSVLSSLRSLKLYGLMGCTGAFLATYSQLRHLSQLHVRGLDMAAADVVGGLAALTCLEDLLWHPMERRLQDVVKLDHHALRTLGSMKRLHTLSLRATAAAAMELPPGSFPSLKSLQVFTPGKPNPMPLLQSILPHAQLTSLEVAVGVYAAEWALDEDDHVFSFDPAYLAGLQAQPSHRTMQETLPNGEDQALLALAEAQPALQRLLIDAPWLLPKTLGAPHLARLTRIPYLDLYPFEVQVTRQELDQMAGCDGSAMKEWRLFLGHSQEEKPWTLAQSYPASLML